MRIGYDVTPLLVPQSGVGTYTANLLAGLGNLPYADEIVPLAHRALAPGNGSVAVNCDGNGRRPWLRPNKTVWMQAQLPRQLRRLDLDICHFTNSVGALWTPCPAVITIHDMTLWLFPQHHYGKRLLAMRPLIPLAARRAAAIIAVSNSARADIVRLLGIPEEKVHVVYEAAAADFRPLPADAALLQQVGRHYRLPPRFVLTVGTIEPRKNLVRLLEAFARVVRRHRDPPALIMVGQRGWKDDAVFAAVERLGLDASVRFLGHVPTDHLVALYNLAMLLAFPSLYEGFGLPVMEAMACGTPVVCSPCGSLAEVAGAAAEFVDPLDVESIAAGLERVLVDPQRREDLRGLGLAQAARFTWQEAAMRTRRVYAAAA